MNARGAVIGFLVITAAYLGALVWADSRNHVFSALPRLLAALPFLAGLSMLAYLVRYARWYWLLARAGHRTRVGRGFLAYLAGFAFTATPGKVGELLRVRYLVPQGVPPFRVVAAFVYERAFDLVVVLALASFAVDRAGVFVVATIFVVAFISCVGLFATHPGWLDVAAQRLRLTRHPRVGRLVATLRDGLAMCRTWVTPLDVCVAAAAGLVAWSITSAAFVWLLGRLGVSIATLPAFGMYPLAMLAGAASMLPGGIGSTEAAIVALLLFVDVPIATATLAAVGIRLASLWFAIACGFVAAGVLEARDARRRSMVRS